MFLDWVLMFAGSVGAIACGAVALNSRTRAEKPIGVVAMIPVLLISVPMVFIVLPRVSWLTRTDAFSEVTQRAKPVIAAIESYTTDHGAPPNDLASLVPAYLEEVPGTGLRAYPELGYWSSGQEWGFEFLCSRGLGNFDRFYYPPELGDEQRSDIELIEGWAYYRE